MDRLLDVLSILSILLILLVLRSVRREHIRVEHSVAWLVAAVALLVLSQSRLLMEDLAKLLGIADSALALIFAILIVFLGVFYRQSRAVSELKDMSITLTQRVAILEYQLRSRDEAAKQKQPDAPQQDANNAGD
mgnify:CR=1 FL=1